jgi:hypothetical protein
LKKKKIFLATTLPYRKFDFLQSLLKFSTMAFEIRFFYAKNVYFVCIYKIFMYNLCIKYVYFTDLGTFRYSFRKNTYITKNCLHPLFYQAGAWQYGCCKRNAYHSRLLFLKLEARNITLQICKHPCPDARHHPQTSALLKHVSLRNTHYLFKIYAQNMYK